MNMKKAVAVVKTESSIVPDNGFNCVVLRKVELVNGSFADIGERINFESINTNLNKVDLIKAGIIKDIG